MRAKFQLQTVTKGTGYEVLNFAAVGPQSYPADGTDEDNQYARWTPSAKCEINVTNPELFGKFAAGQKFYVDFTPAD